ncbi:MAG: transporter substrate-binding domain-containing protein [Actinobacteria bacterium]|nr:transporter substrate-binding domain-containing protein [Actinomycetota bacterium]
MTVVAIGCGDDDDDEGAAGSGSGIRTIKSGVLTVCSDIPYAPFEFEEGGKSVGIDLDLVAAIASDLGLRAEVKDTDFDGIFAALAAGQCDLIASSVSITDERKQSNEFTQGYYEIQQSLLVRKADAALYNSLDALKGRTIGVQSETTGEAYAQSAATGATIKSFTGADELFTALKAGQIDGVVQDYPVNAYNATHGGDTTVSARFQTQPEQYGFVIKKGNVALRDAVDASLSKIRSSGQYDEILRRYLGAAP